MLGGLESRLKKETDSVREELGKAIGELGARVEKTEKRLGGLTEEVNSLIDKRLGKSLDTVSPLLDGSHGHLVANCFFCLANCLWP